MPAALDFDRLLILEAIANSGGVVRTVAQRLACDWHTAKKYIDKWVSTKRAFEAETEWSLDRAESLIVRNIELGLRQQTELKRPVDSGDAKWYLSRKGKKRGYAPSTQHLHEGPGLHGEILHRDAKDLTDDELADIAAGGSSGASAT